MLASYYVASQQKNCKYEKIGEGIAKRLDYDYC